MFKFNVFRAICLTCFSTFLQSCASTDSVRYASHPVDGILNGVTRLPFEIVGNVLEVPAAVLGGRKPKFTFSDAARFDRAWSHDDYDTMTKFIKDGFDINYKRGDQSISYIAGYCDNQQFSKAVINRKGFNITDFKKSADPKFKEAIAKNDEKTIRKYFSCGYPKYSYIESNPLVYWAGRYGNKDIANLLDSKGINSSSYKKGLYDGIKIKIDDYFAQAALAHFIEQALDGCGLFSALTKVAAITARDTAIAKLYQTILPNYFDSTTAGLVAKNTGLLLDRKLTKFNMAEKDSLEILKNKINERNPGLGNIVVFVYNTQKTMERAKANNKCN